MRLEEKKRDHHYVFQAYLKKWANKNGKIWCLRGGKLFDVKPINICFQKNFYRISSLNRMEINLIKLIFKDESEIFKSQLDDFLERYSICDIYETMTNITRTTAPPFYTKTKIAIENMDLLIDTARSNMIEDAHCRFERESIKWLNSLCEESTEFFYSPFDNQNMDFISFVCLQYFRTEKIKDYILNELKQIENEIVPEHIPAGIIRIDNICQPVILLITAICAAELSQACLVLLLNKTEVPFITSDQPVINVKKESVGQAKYEFYYPISPKVAIKLNNDFDGKTLILKDKEEVYKYNDLISKESYKMLFSNNLEVLERYIK